MLTAGHVNWDVTMQVDRLPEPDGEQPIAHLTQAGGGSAANVATGLVGFDTDTALFGSVGGDDSGALALRELDRVGVDCGHVMIADGRATSVKYLIVDRTGEVMVLSSEGANEAYAATDLETDVFKHISHLHLTGQDPETAGNLAASARDHGVAVSFDPGRRLGDREYTRALRHTDLLFVNRREADLLAGTFIDPDAPETLTLVVKLGGDGAMVRPANAGSTSISVPAYAVTPVDTTGAGDAFAAGFLAACFEPAAGETIAVDGDGPGSSGESRSGVRNTTVSHLRQADLEYALRIGNAAGALATLEYGARTRLSWDRIAAFLDDQ